MASLDDIRRRFSRATGSINWRDAFLKSPKPAINGAAARIFDPLKTFQMRVSEIVENAGIIERSLTAAEHTMDDLNSFYLEMKNFIEAYQTLRTYECLLGPQSADELGQYFDAIAKIFDENLSAIGAILNPVPPIYSRILEFGRILRNIETIQSDFRSLAEQFKPHPVGGEVTAPVQPPTPSAKV